MPVGRPVLTPLRGASEEPGHVRLELSALRARPRDRVAEEGNSFERGPRQCLDRSLPCLRVGHGGWPDLRCGGVPHILEERVATDGDAVDGISRPVARRMPSGETNRKQQAAWTDEPTKLNERSSLVDVMEYRHSGDDVERILLDLTGEQISDDVVDVIARLSSLFDA